MNLRKTHIFIVLTFLLFCNTTINSQSCISNDEKEGLFAFLEKNDWLSNYNWDKNKPLSQWQGLEIKDCKVIGLDFTKASIRKIPDEIAYLENLEYLRFQDEWFSKNEISRNLFTLPNLTELSLIDTDLKNFIPLLPRLKKLKKLDISEAHFDTIPSVIFKLKNLEYLDVSNNEYLEGGISKLKTLTKLKYLSFENNKRLEFYPSVIKDLKDLEVLKLSKVRVYLNVMNLSNQPKLKILTLYDTELEALPLGLENMTELSYLDLGGNYINDFPDKVVKNLKSLKTLKIEKNDLNSIPNFKLAVSTLDTLDVSSNPIFKFSNQDINNLKLVKHIDIGNMLVQLTKENFEALKEAESIDISKNNIKSIDGDLSRFKNLKKINLDKNQLNSLPKGLEMVSTLEDLSFVENNIKEIPKEIYKLKNLTHLMLDVYEVKKVPKELLLFKNLKELFIVFEGEYDETLCELKARKVKIHYTYVTCKEDED